MPDVFLDHLDDGEPRCGEAVDPPGVELPVDEAGVESFALHLHDQWTVLGAEVHPTDPLHAAARVDLTAEHREPSAPEDLREPGFQVARGRDVAAGALAE